MKDCLILKMEEMLCSEIFTNTTVKTSHWFYELKYFTRPDHKLRYSLPAGCD